MKIASTASSRCTMRYGFLKELAFEKFIDRPIAGESSQTRIRATLSASR